MKAAIRILVLVGIAGLLFWSNPSQPDFESYIQERVETRLGDEAGSGRLGRLMTDLGSSIVGSLAARVSDRSNYVLFSTYTVDVGADGDPDEAWRFLGVAGNFIELSSPNSE